MKEKFAKLNNQRWKILNIITLSAVFVLGIFIGIKYFKISDGLKLRTTEICFVGSDNYQLSMVPDCREN